MQERQDHWRLFVYDMANCEVLHTAARLTCNAAKSAALEFAVFHLDGPSHDLKLQTLMRMLVWEAEPQFNGSCVEISAFWIHPVGAREPADLAGGGWSR